MLHCILLVQIQLQVDQKSPHLTILEVEISSLFKVSSTSRFIFFLDHDFLFHDFAWSLVQDTLSCFFLLILFHKCCLEMSMDQLQSEHHLFYFLIQFFRFCFCRTIFEAVFLRKKVMSVSVRFFFACWVFSSSSKEYHE